MSFKYEQLPMFCFVCSLISYTEKFCPKFLDGFNELEKVYSSDLRAFVRIGKAYGNRQ